MNKTDLEQQAVDAVLAPLADYVCAIGAEKSLDHYSKAEILGLINTILDTHQQALQALYKDEIPF